MAYVINGGDKPSSRFHDFVDLCCEAYNLIRKHTHLFLNLLGLVCLLAQTHTHTHNGVNTNLLKEPTRKLNVCVCVSRCCPVGSLSSPTLMT